MALLSAGVRAKSLTARFNLGMAYYNGDGVAQNSLKAAQWLQVAEKQNFAEAQYVLGMLFVEGDESLTKNLNLGVTYLRKATNQNHKLAKAYLQKMDIKTEIKSTSTGGSLSMPSGSTQLGDVEILREARMYYTGIGKTRDYEKAFSMLLPLAKGGYAEAARLVGLMKLSGKGTEKNPTDAKQWLSVAAQKGDQTARRMLVQYKSLF